MSWTADKFATANSGRALPHRLGGWRRRVRRKSQSPRFCIVSMVVTAVILGSGWLWARLLISTYQRQKYSTVLDSSRTGDEYFWGWSWPANSTGLLLLIICLTTLTTLLWRRQFALACIFVSYALGLLLAYVFLFGGLGFEAFP